MSLKFAEPVGRAISWWLKSRNYEKFSIKSNYSAIVGRAKIRQNSKFDKASQKCMSSYISAEKPVSKIEKKKFIKRENMIYLYPLINALIVDGIFSHILLFRNFYFIFV